MVDRNLNRSKQSHELVSGSEDQWVSPIHDSAHFKKKNWNWGPRMRPKSVAQKETLKNP